MGTIILLSVWEGLQDLYRVTVSVGTRFHWVRNHFVFILKEVWLYIETLNVACYPASLFPANTPTHSVSPPFGLSCNKMSCLILFMGLIVKFFTSNFPHMGLQKYVRKTIMYCC